MDKRIDLFYFPLRNKNNLIYSFLFGLVSNINSFSEIAYCTFKSLILCHVKCWGRG